MNKQQVFDSIDWERVMSANRSAGGHYEVMSSIFGDSAEIIAEWIEDFYCGNEAFAYQFPDGTVAIATDSFGSCPGCDSWEDSSDDEARAMIQSIVSSARVFPGVQEALDFCRTVNEDAAHYHIWPAENLISQLEQRLEQENSS